MLIPFEQLCRFISSNNKSINGILHIGAHDCQEKYDYNINGIDDSKIIWIEGNSELVEKNKDKNLNIYHALIDNEEKEVDFKIMTSTMSSSLLDLGIHSTLYPDVTLSKIQKQHTIRLDTFFEKNNIDPSKYDFWNIDIQGTELRALQSAEKYLKHINYIYTEANTMEIYKGCSLLHEMDDYLAKYGFARLGFKEYENHGWGDAFYYRVANTL